MEPTYIYLSHSANRNDNPDWFIVQHAPAITLEQEVDSLRQAGARGRRVLRINLETLETSELPALQPAT